MIRTVVEPLNPEGGTVVLYGNLAPDGAVLKQTAASPRLLQHRGRAYVFETYQEMRAQIDREDLPVDENTVLVMKGCGQPSAAPFAVARSLGLCRLNVVRCLRRFI